MRGDAIDFALELQLDKQMRKLLLSRETTGQIVEVFQ